VFESAATGALVPETSDVDLLVDLGGYERGVANVSSASPRRSRISSIIEWIS